MHPQYHDLEQEASALTRRMHELAAENVSERELLEFYDRSLLDERAAPPQALEAMYREAGIAFPDGLRRRLEEVEDFHERLLSNRRGYLVARWPV